MCGSASVRVRRRQGGSVEKGNFLLKTALMKRDGGG